jgi:glutathione peroxidase
MKMPDMTFTLMIALAAATAGAQTKSGGNVPAVLSFTVASITGQPVNLSRYQGQVVLIVNTASECGYTYQYAGLQNLHRKYAAQGLRILGFPSNDFGQQEPGTNAEIQQFCKSNYGVEFDMFSKVQVLGRGKTPLFDYLTSSSTNPKFAGEIKWNFEKFLIGRDGQIIGRFPSAVEPESKEMTRAIESALARAAGH